MVVQVLQLELTPGTRYKCVFNLFQRALMTDTSMKAEKEILAIADEMAASVSDFSPQNYYTFLEARKKFQTTVHEALKEVERKKSTT